MIDMGVTTIHVLVLNQNRISMSQGDNKQTRYPRGISGQRRRLRLLKKMLYKSLPSALDIQFNPPPHH